MHGTHSTRSGKLSIVIHFSYVEHNQFQTIGGTNGIRKNILIIFGNINLDCLVIMICRQQGDWEWTGSQIGNIFFIFVCSVMLIMAFHDCVEKISSLMWYLCLFLTCVSVSFDT